MSYPQGTPLTVNAREGAKLPRRFAVMCEDRGGEAFYTLYFSCPIGIVQL